MTLINFISANWTDYKLLVSEFTKVSLSVILGCILGLEREVRGKSAGFRTVALICLGATVFTLTSSFLGNSENQDRIAANIITGVGFIGAGVIFHNNLSVSGVTTAASIWIAAAIGMLIGIGNFMLAAFVLLLSLFILYILDFIQIWIDYRFQHRVYQLLIRSEYTVHLVEVEATILKLTISKIKILKTSEHVIFEFEISGKESDLILFNQHLLDDSSIYSFKW